MPESVVVDGAKSKNTMYGYGLIDAYAGLLKILGIPNAIENISTSRPSSVKILPAAGGSVSLSFDNAPSQPFIVKVYTVDGKMIAEQIVTATGVNRYSIATPATSGICVVQINSDEKGVTGSELIRF
jgi:hypothetical protein